MVLRFRQVGEMGNCKLKIANRKLQIVSERCFSRQDVAYRLLTAAQPLGE